MSFDLGRYILGGKDGKTPIPTRDLLDWGKWFESNSRVVARTQIGDVEISTVFIGLNHQFGNGPPLLFETMVFGGSMDQEIERCSTWDEAEDQHREMVARVQAAAGES